MISREIRPGEAAVICAVCGRTLLRGEHSQSYLHESARREVCDLCKARAEHDGWIREGAGQLTTRARKDRGRSLLGRLRGRRDERSATRADGGRATAGDERARDTAAAVHETRHVHAVPTNSELKLSRALELFNHSEHPRTIAGVRRSLGTPAVTVRVSNEHPSVVNVTVAWELCWYRYEVDLADESGTVRVADQGYELADLQADEQQSNATADDRGTLEFVAA